LTKGSEPKLGAIKHLKPKDLVPYAKNSRTHGVEQIDQIVASINEFGFTNPILTDGKGHVIAGHGRLLAALKLGLETVPTISLGHLSAAQRRAYIIADNKLALNAGWSIEILKAELEDLQELDFDLEVLGYGVVELEALLGGDIVTDPNAEYAGMPSFNQEDQGAWKRLVVNFKSPEDIEAFSKAIGQRVGTDTRSLWYPEVKNGVFKNTRYGSDS
tara:strand:+ start:2466 stop:3113 length:648 start_codon:yes stop_codon:yes gene_type:complete